MKQSTSRRIATILLCSCSLLPLQSAQAVATAETELSFLWHTFSVTGGSEGSDYAWNNGSIYYGAHAEALHNDSDYSGFQTNTTNPLDQNQPTSVLTTAGWPPDTQGSAYLTQDDGSGNELARSRGYAYSNNAGDSWANGNSHWVRSLEVYTTNALTFSVDFQLEQDFQIDTASLEQASGFSRPHIYIRDDYNNGAMIAEDFLEIWNGLSGSLLQFDHQQGGTLSFTTSLALGNSGMAGYADIGLYTFEGHAHTSASATSRFAQSNPVPEPDSILLLGLGLALLGLGRYHQRNGRHH